MPLEDDFLMRTMRRLTDALARIAGLRSAGAYDEAQAAINDAYRALGVGRATIARLDAPSAALVLGTREKLAALAHLVDEEMRLAEALGDAPRAARCRAEARGLAAELSKS